jgi:Fic family protein
MSRGPDPKIDAISILSVVLASPDPAFTAWEIADALDVTAEGARHQMNRLVDAGYLAKKKPGHRTTIYWPTDAGLRYYVEATSE